MYNTVLHACSLVTFGLTLKVQFISFNLIAYCLPSNIMSKKTAMVILAHGAEEMELVISVDILRRAGVAVTIAGLAGDDPVKCSRDVVVCADASFDDALKKGPYDAIVLPGGLVGSKNLSSSSTLGSYLKKHEKGGRIVGAICAAPTALKAHGIGVGKTLTSYPSTREQMEEGSKYKYSEEKVVVDGKLVTSRGPGTTFDFALALVEQLVGKDVRDNVAKGMLWQ